MLLVRAGGGVCALPIEAVVETMRPLATAPLSGTAAFVAGAAVVRGAPVPVVDLRMLVAGVASASPAGRFVLVRCGPRNAALAVDAVLGVAHLDARRPAPVPALAHAAAGAIESLGAQDGELLLVLRAAELVPEDAWRALREREAGA